MRTLAPLCVFICSLSAANTGTDIVFEDRFEKAGIEGFAESWSMWQGSDRYLLSVQRVRSGDGSWRIRMAGSGSRFAKARAFRTITGLRSGEWYRFETVFSASNIPNPPDCALALVEIPGDRRRVLVPVREVGEYRSSVIMQIPERANGSVRLHLFAGYIPNGVVEWKQIRVERIASYRPPSRPVRVAVIDSAPSRPGSVEDNARHYAAEIDRLSAGGAVDLILFPEHMNTTRVIGTSAVAINSPYIEILRNAARRNRTYLAGSIHEAWEGTVFNTGFLIDRQGLVAGTYEKTHLTVSEMLFTPLTRGEEFKVFKTDFGSVAMMVCFDFHYPEAPRLVAQRGAEIVLVPMAADGRLKENGHAFGAEYAGRTFALENRIPVIFAATLAKNEQPSLIIDQNARVLARSNSEQHTIRATVSLEAKAIQEWTGEDFHALQIVGRRPELYGELGVK